MRGLIAFSLYGSDIKYTVGILANARDLPVYYPGWKMRVYLEKGHWVKPALLEFPHVEVVEREAGKGTTGAFWRIEAAAEPGPVLFRDADSRFSRREVAAVDAWLEAPERFHLMNDHPYHAGTPVMAGMWGVKGPCPEVAMAAEAYLRNRKEPRYGDDQRLLAEVIPLSQAKRHSSVGGGEEFPQVLVDRTRVGDYAPVTLEDAIPFTYVICPRQYQGRWDSLPRNLRGSEFLSGIDKRRWEWPGPGEVWEPPSAGTDWAAGHFWRATLSHLAVLNDAWVKGYPAVMVLEDDVVAEPWCDDVLRAAWAALLGEEGWLGLQLSSEHLMPCPEVKPGLRRAVGLNSTYGYIWSREGIGRVLESMWHSWGNHVIDVVTGLLQAESGKVFTPDRWVLRPTYPGPNSCEAPPTLPQSQIDEWMVKNAPVLDGKPKGALDLRS